MGERQRVRKFLGDHRRFFISNHVGFLKSVVVSMQMPLVQMKSLLYEGEIARHARITYQSFRPQLTPFGV